MDDFQALRREYTGKPLDMGDVGNEPISFFNSWLQEAIDSGCMEPNAMTLATSDASGQVHARMVLLKGIEDHQFLFFTNYDSDKGRQLLANPTAALVFFWPELSRQVRVEGSVEQLSTAASDEYFQSRPVGSRVSATVSPQSREVPSREWLEEKWKALHDGQHTIQRPENWGGYRLNPTRVEFWQGRPDRLHDRIVFIKTQEQWIRKRLAP